MALESNFQGSAQMTLHAADNGHIKLEGSGIREIGPAIGLWPGDRKDKPSSWLSIESLGGRPAISLISSDGPRARLDLNSGPALTLEGPFGNASSSASLAIRPYDKGPSLLMSATGSSLMLSTGGAGARVSVVNGLEDGDSWSTPLPAKKK